MYFCTDPEISSKKIERSEFESLVFRMKKVAIRKWWGQAKLSFSKYIYRGVALRVKIATRVFRFCHVMHIWHVFASTRPLELQTTPNSMPLSPNPTVYVYNLSDWYKRGLPSRNVYIERKQELRVPHLTRFNSLPCELMTKCLKNKVSNLYSYYYYTLTNYFL